MVMGHSDSEKLAVTSTWATLSDWGGGWGSGYTRVH